MYSKGVQFEIAGWFHNQQAMVVVRSNPEVPGVVRVLNHDVFKRDRLANPLSRLPRVVDDTGVNQSLALLAGIIVCLLAILLLSSVGLLGAVGLLGGVGLLIRGLLVGGRRGVLGSQYSGQQHHGTHGHDRFLGAHHN